MSRLRAAYRLALLDEDWQRVQDLARLLDAEAGCTDRAALAAEATDLA